MRIFIESIYKINPRSYQTEIKGFEVYNLWSGRKAKSKHTGELFIETPINQWDTRVKIWKQNLDNDACPCPMPEGHIMFESDYSYIQLI